MMSLDCPAYVDEEGAVRCGLPAEVERRFTMRSSGGPLESAMIRCPAGHWFNGPIEFLSSDSTVEGDGGNAGAACPRRDSLTGNHDDLGGRGKLVAREFDFEPAQQFSRPNGAPAYYLGRPAWLWITAMSPRRSRTAPDLIAASNGQLDAGRRPEPRPTAAAMVRGGAL